MGSSYVEAPVLVGRATELERCDRLLAAATSGRGTLLLVSGEAGIGKTALVTAIGERATAGEAAFGLGRCFETDAMPAFAPWQELLLELHRTGLAGLDQLPAPFGNAAASRTAYELQQHVTRRLIDAASQRPIVRCLDDVHQADPDTLELLWYLVRELHTARVLAMDLSL
jgi:predicted ATPase